MNPEVVVNTVLTYASQQLVPEKYQLFVGIVQELVIKGLHEALTEKLSIDGFDIKFMDEKPSN